MIWMGRTAFCATWYLVFAHRLLSLAFSIYGASVVYWYICLHDPSLSIFLIWISSSILPSFFLYSLFLVLFFRLLFAY